MSQSKRITEMWFLFRSVWFQSPLTGHIWRPAWGLLSCSWAQEQRAWGHDTFSLLHWKPWHLPLLRDTVPTIYMLCSSDILLLFLFWWKHPPSLLLLLTRRPGLHTQRNCVWGQIREDFLFLPCQKIVLCGLPEGLGRTARKDAELVLSSHGPNISSVTMCPKTSKLRPCYEDWMEQQGAQHSAWPHRLQSLWVPSFSFYLCLSLLYLPAILPTGSLLFTEELCSGTQWTKSKKPFQVGGKAMWAGKTKNASPKAQGWEGKLVGRVRI